MDSEKIYPLIRANIVPIALGLIGIVLLVLGLFQLYINKTPEAAVVFTQESQDKKTEMVIDVEGAVINPGVYKLISGSRTVDALAAAGGLSEDADRVWVEKNINLASKVSDGLKIYIPRSGEDILSQGASTDSSIGSGGPVININSASQSDLESLPGVGEVTALKMIEARPFAQIEELKTKNVIGEATYEKIKDKISAN